MDHVQWCIRVRKNQGEATRRSLIEQDLLDRSLKIRSAGDDLLIPVREEISGAEKGTFESLPVREELPRHEQIGGIAVLAEDDSRQASYLLSARPNLHTVLYAESAVEGVFRLKRFRVLAGIETTKTSYVEYGIRFNIDLAEAYFSARLSSERQRIKGMMKPGECVADMFAGVGPFALILSEIASLVYACDINPGAVSLLIQNIRLNKRENILPILADALNLPFIIPCPADRVIMNLPVSSTPFLEAALRICRPHGMIHCYALVSEEEELISLIRQYPVEDVQVRHVRSYSPDRFHVVYDIRKKG